MVLDKYLDKFGSLLYKKTKCSKYSAN
jgi:hypothetical protein